MKLLLSIHDVMPETLDRVERAIDTLGELGLPPAMLLVVPGRPWTDKDLERVHGWAAAGHELAGHGWQHRAERITRFRHRLYSALISGNVAEHLELDEPGIAELIVRCHRWFSERAFPAPRLYVPPAWAMGRVSHARLTTLPFRYYETLPGIFDAARQAMRRLPVLGFEARGRIRCGTLKLSNAVNKHLAKLTGSVRLAVHPYDFSLPLARDLMAMLRQNPERIVSFDGLLAPELGPA
ncbi:MAG: polysaccharide deacetylase family protein [Gammaproteobacteria bacterium]